MWTLIRLVFSGCVLTYASEQLFALSPVSVSLSLSSATSSKQAEHKVSKMATPNNSPMLPRDPIAVAQGHRAAYRWLINLAGDINLDTFDGEMAMRLWREVSPGLYCCHQCGDDRWCSRGLDYFMAGIVIYLLKFYGHGMSRQDRVNVRYIRARFLDSPENRAEMIDFELEMMDLLAPVLFRIQEECVDYMERAVWVVDRV